MNHSLLFRIAAVTVAVAAVTALLAACGDDDDSAKTAPAAASSTASPSPSAAASASPPASASALPSVSAATSVAASPTASTSAAPSATTTTATQAPPAPTATQPAPSGPMSASVGVVEGKTFLFSPANVTIARGGTVSFAWSGTTQFHDVVVRSGGTELGRSGDPAKSGSFSYTFSTPGTYQFVCEVHEASIPPMRGTVTVQ